MEKKNIKCFDNFYELSLYAAQLILESGLRGIKEKGTFSIALSGGNTPESVYEILAEKSRNIDFEWDKAHLFWADERWVTPDNPYSNYRLVESALLSRIEIPPENVHLINTLASSPEKAAEDYHKELKDFFRESGFAFDLVLLGIGEDGHTASVFPGVDFDKQANLWVINTPPPKIKPSLERITITLECINCSREVVFLVSGENKAEILKEVVENENPLMPAAKVKPKTGYLTFLIDRKAGSKLDTQVEAEKVLSEVLK
jgi:6-phosphogluconolactonase